MALRALYVAIFLGFGVATPYLQVLLSRLGFNKQQVGAIQGSLELMAVLAPPCWGYLSDRWRHPRLALLLTAGASAPLFLLFGLAGTYALALAVAVGFGAFFRPQIPLADGYTFRYIHRHGGDYGRIRIGGSISFIVCLLVVEQLGIGGPEPVPLIMMSMVVAGLVLMGSVLNLPGDDPAAAPAGAGAEPLATAAARSAADPPTAADWRAFLTRGVLLFTCAAFLGRIAMTSYYHFFSLYLKERLGFDQAGYIWLLGPLSEMPVIFFSGRIMARIGTKALFELGLLGVVVRLVGYSLVTDIAHVIPLQLLHSLTFGAFHTASVNFVARAAPLRLKNSAQALFSAVTIGLGGLVGGWVGGYVAEHHGFTVLYQSFGALAIIALILLIFLVPSDHPRAARPSPPTPDRSAAA